MKICPKCGKEFTDDVTYCLVDQNTLVSTETANLRRRAEVLQLLAWLSFVGAVLCIFGAIIAFVNVGAEAGAPWGWIYISGSLVSISIVLFLFAQLVHIRASLEKKN